MNVSAIVSDILSIYAVGHPENQNAIETYLAGCLDGSENRAGLLKQLIAVFEPPEKDHSLTRRDDSGDLFKLLLGQDLSHAGLSNQELMDRMAECMDTIFSQLNEILSAINNPLVGTGDVTIRYVIREHLVQGNDLNNLKDRISQIKNAYLATHESFKSASKIITKQLLEELNPNTIMKSLPSGLKFGSLKKADGFKEFEIRYGKCLKWFESGRSDQDLLNVFEKEYFKRLYSKEEKN